MSSNSSHDTKDRVTSPASTLKEDGENVGRNTPDGEDVVMVDWDGPDDAANPQKLRWNLIILLSLLTFVVCCSWSYGRKWAATLVVSSFTFISPVSSSMVAPASAQLAKDLGITSPTVTAMSVSIFVLAYGMSLYLFLIS